MPLLMCPNCETGMKEVDRDGVRIDICPSCRGVWLDRGELEKLLASVRAAGEAWEREPPPPSSHQPYAHRPDPHHGHYHKKRKKPWDEFFDFFD